MIFEVAAHCCVCPRAITFALEATDGQALSQALEAAADAALWTLDVIVVDGEIYPHDHCPEHRLAPPVAEMVEQPA